jgi:predicted metal-dependent hydrolase
MERAMNSDERKKKFQIGLEHFNAEKFFEAHEFWEEIWLCEAEPEKTFLQGLIQVTAAFHHYQRGNPEGTELLLAAGIVKLSRFPEDHHGLAIGKLRSVAKSWARALGAAEDPGKEALPRLERASGSADTRPTKKKTKTRARR